MVKSESEQAHEALPRKFGGGPHGLGDPNDKSLRKVEKDVLIMEKVRKKTRTHKCVDEVKAFVACCRASSFAMVYKCREENKALRICSERWYRDEALIEECTKEYLEERSEYRRTGITKKQKEYSRLVGSMH